MVFSFYKDSVTLQRNGKSGLERLVEGCENALHPQYFTVALDLTAGVGSLEALNGKRSRRT
jgi:hypothetical protein